MAATVLIETLPALSLREPVLRPERTGAPAASGRQAALIEDRLVQAGFCPHVPARLFGIACRRLRHRPYFQVFETDNRVVLADCVRRLVQEVFADVADAGMKLYITALKDGDIRRVG